MTGKVVQAPKCTSQPITDIMRWLKEGSIVRLYNSDKQQETSVFDIECPRKENEIFRLIWVDFAQEPSLLQNKRMIKILEKDDYTPCTCSIAGKIAEGQIISPFSYRRDISQGPAKLISEENKKKSSN
jgi:hypothetical protein